MWLGQEGTANPYTINYTEEHSTENTNIWPRFLVAEICYQRRKVQTAIT